MRKGCLELCVLASLWTGRMYGLEILRVLDDESRLAVAEGTIYPILNRLKNEGLVESEWVEAEAGHPRKYYSLTKMGRLRARHMARVWGEFSENLAAFIRPLMQKQEKSA